MNYKPGRNETRTPAIDASVGKAAVANAETRLSLISWAEISTSVTDRGNCGQVLFSFKSQIDGAWIIDFGATDHMTFDPNDFSHMTQPR